MAETNLLITLEAARMNCGLTLVSASNKLGIHRDTLWRYEKDSSNVPRSFISKVEEIYRIPQRYIFFGKKSDFFRMLQEAN